MISEGMARKAGWSRCSPGWDGYAIVYRRETGALVIDVGAVDAEGKAQSVRVYASRPPKT